MTKTIGQFDYTTIHMGEQDRIPFDPFVVINLQHWGDQTAGGAPVISAHLMSDDEIDEHIMHLKTDLEAVGAKAKRALKREQTLAIVSARTSS